MRRLAFIITVLGICVLVLILVFSGEVVVGNYDDLEELELNTKVSLAGFVDEERMFDGFRILEVEGIDVVCDCFGVGVLEGKRVFVNGVVGEFNGRRQVELLELRVE